VNSVASIQWTQFDCPFGPFGYWHPFRPYVIIACGFHIRSVKTKIVSQSHPFFMLDENLRANPFSCWARASKYRANPFSCWMHPLLYKANPFSCWMYYFTEPSLFHIGCKDTIMLVNDYPLCHTLLCSLPPESILSIITPSCEGPHQAYL
jgi:hypothetical protein